MILVVEISLSRPGPRSRTIKIRTNRNSRPLLALLKLRSVSNKCTALIGFLFYSFSNFRLVLFFVFPSPSPSSSSILLVFLFFGVNLESPVPWPPFPRRSPSTTRKKHHHKVTLNLQINVQVWWRVRAHFRLRSIDIPSHRPLNAANVSRLFDN